VSLKQIKSDWTTLGDADPLWAVLADPGRRGGRWDNATFLATGRAEVDAALAHAARLGLTRRGEALDFGCGAGRLSLALADRVTHVVGVDISAPMLARARELDPTGRCEYIESVDPDLRRFGESSFDVVFSSLVLQHVPQPTAQVYLAEMVRVLRPGGALIVQVATSPDHSAKGFLVRILPRRAVRVAQRRVLGYPAPMDMYPLRGADVEATIERAGGTVLDVVPDPMYGGNWRYARYFATNR
jgi:SAM-dependent methyltransferase